MTASDLEGSHKTKLVPPAKNEKSESVLSTPALSAIQPLAILPTMFPAAMIEMTALAFFEEIPIVEQYEATKKMHVV